MKAPLIFILACLFFVFCEKDEWSNVGFEPNIADAVTFCHSKGMNPAYKGSCGKSVS